jgi:D-alanine-D-alanine ligase
MTTDQILSFSEKYQKGGKKSGGMASLTRQLPVKISSETKGKIESYSKTIYKTFKCSGVVRIDYIEHQGQIFFNEINPIPGSLSYYLWEAKGIPFKKQLTDLVEESIKNFKEKNSISFVHRTDIIKTFIKNFR